MFILIIYLCTILLYFFYLYIFCYEELWLTDTHCEYKCTVYLIKVKSLITILKTFKATRDSNFYEKTELYYRSTLSIFHLKKKN